MTAVDDHDGELAERVRAAGGRFVEPDHVGLEELARLVESGRLVPHVSRTFRLDEAAAAHQLVGAGSVQGKGVLTVTLRVQTAPAHRV